MHPDVKEILLTEEQIATRVAELGQQLTKDYENQPLVLVSVLTGAITFTADLMRKIQGDVLLDTLIASSYGSGTVSKGQVNIKKDLSQDIAGKHVLLVDDVCDTGRTMAVLCEILKERGAASVKTCVMLDKPSRREVDFVPDYIGYKIPDVFVIGYGLDYDSKYRHLPYIGRIRPECVK